jgi:hypothetical protein
MRERPVSVEVFIRHEEGAGHRSSYTARVKRNCNARQQTAGSGSNGCLLYHDFENRRADRCLTRAAWRR